MFKIFAISFLIASSSFAAEKKMRAVNEPPIRKGAMIEVSGYDAAARIYSVVIVNERGVGPNRAKFEDMLEAVSTLNKNLVTAKPNSIVGNQYTLDKELPLLADKGVEIRKKDLSRKK